MTEDSGWSQAPGKGPATTRLPARWWAAFRRSRLAKDLTDWCWIVGQVALLLFVLHLRDVIAQHLTGGTP